MIKRIKNWTKKSEQNSLAFTGFAIITIELMWFIPYSMIILSKYGLCETIPISYIFTEVGLTLLSIWIGFKFAMKFLFK